ncbi:hypothetical protein, partial [Paenibacillus sp. 598K]|uniref:hypothetical protein n=1 Tax=Paenibacillus sp. 598K TaxID=1117987 RepID=UPI001625F340
MQSKSWARTGIAAVAAIVLLTGWGPMKSAETAVAEGALDITAMDDLVSINYSLWFDPVVPKGGGTIYDVADILTESGIQKAAPAWG